MILILAVGQRQPAWVNSAVIDYLNRIPENQRPQLREIKAEPRVAGKTVNTLMRAEADRLLAAIPKDSAMIALDERGEPFTTHQFADFLNKLALKKSNITFLIGGPDGLDSNLRLKSDRIVKLSYMTLPHGLARLILAEQLYRIHALLRGHPYHRN